MNKYTSKELRKLWHEFYAERGHKQIASASLLPENDPSVLFTTAGMHPLVPYLMGEKHPSGNRLCSVQKCVRTGDIEEVGDPSHCTFFEMLGNWSLGDYFKKEQIAWSYLFLTSEKYLGIDKNSLAVTVFAGDADAPRDDESAKLWQECGFDKSKIFFLPKKHNWWGPAGVTGPCGPDTEMFFILDRPDCGKDCNPSCDCGKYLEIWNDVFMQYNKTLDGKFELLQQKNVDTGMGLERVLCILGGFSSVYDTDVFRPIIEKINQLSQDNHADTSSELSAEETQDNSKENSAENLNEKTKATRIVADHIRTSVHIIGDERGVLCSNVDQGYILRRLIRRSIRYAKKLGIKPGGLQEIARTVIEIYKDAYPELLENKDKILGEINAEEERFEKTLSGGLKEFEKLLQYLQGKTISGKASFRLYDTFGFPLEMTQELAKERGYMVDEEGFARAFKEHQEKSKTGAEAKFKGGLADSAEKTTRLHTATHLLHAALKKVLCDENVNQKGSNITEERLRFDFSFARPLTNDEIKQVEKQVNDAIAANATIQCQEMTVEEARNAGAVGLFGSKYGEKVKVYTMGEFSKEICGGPHAASTGELGTFKIIKEQSSSSGIRRIKAILE
jgi:alanyl-tRNA synthetase